MGVAPRPRETSPRHRRPGQGWRQRFVSELEALASPWQLLVAALTALAAVTTIAVLAILNCSRRRRRRGFKRVGEEEEDEAGETFSD